MGEHSGSEANPKDPASEAFNAVKAVIVRRRVLGFDEFGKGLDRGQTAASSTLVRCDACRCFWFAGVPDCLVVEMPRHH